jgi:16S rRNA (cytosine1402-N4)-methyltransferase
MKIHHTPVLLKESINYLVTDKSGIYFDATLGFGGHTEAFLKVLNEDAVIAATDVDKDAFNFSREKFANEERVKLYNFNFSEIDSVAKIESFGFFDGIFADLGVSSFQLDNPDSGFTYREEAKLDLRMDKSKVVNAADLINSFSEEDLADIFFNYGEERNSRRIAREICKQRIGFKIETTSQLSEIITKVIPFKNQNKTLSRIFQALRIYVNDELSILETFLDKSVTLLKTGGKIVVISYHSLEDRIVKEKFKYETLDCICPKEFPVCKCDKKRRIKILTKKPIAPLPEEIALNPRARSAKLRAAERV